MPDSSPKLWVGITDYDWFKLHASKESVEEVNFWRPTARQWFRALQPGGLFLFKLRSRKEIGGGGFFAKYLPLPLSLAYSGRSPTVREGSAVPDVFDAIRQLVTPPPARAKPIGFRPKALKK